MRTPLNGMLGTLDPDGRCGPKAPRTWRFDLIRASDKQLLCITWTMWLEISAGPRRGKIVFAHETMSLRRWCGNGRRSACRSRTSRNRSINGVKAPCKTTSSVIRTAPPGFCQPDRQQRSSSPAQAPFCVEPMRARGQRHGRVPGSSIDGIGIDAADKDRGSTNSSPSPSRIRAPWAHRPRAPPIRAAVGRAMGRRCGLESTKGARQSLLVPPCRRRPVLKAPPACRTGSRRTAARPRGGLSPSPASSPDRGGNRNATASSCVTCSNKEGTRG